MRPRTALAAFGVVLAASFGAGAALGSTAGPIDTSGGHDADHDRSRTVEVDGHRVHLDGVLEPDDGSDATITVERDGQVRTGRVVFDDPAAGESPTHDHEGR